MAISIQPFKYEAVRAKCRCLIGRLLTREQYVTLANKSSLADAVIYLKEETAYSDVLENVEAAHIHRTRLEQLLENHLLNAYIKLYTFTSGAERKFIGSLLEEYELRYLLHAIRASKYDDSMESYIIPQFIRERSNVDFLNTYKACSGAELLDALSGTEYYELLYPLLTAEKLNFAAIEAELLRNYYKKLLESAAATFSGDERKRISDAIKTKIDLANLSVILRLRRFGALREGKERVKLDITAVLNLLIPFFGRLSEADIISLCQEELSIEETIDRVAALFKKPGTLFGEQTSTGVYGSAFLFGQAKKLASARKPSFDIVLGYLLLLRFETDNIIYILEALRYGVAAQNIEDRIII